MSQTMREDWPGLAVLALTPRGMELGQRLVDHLGYGEVLSVRDDCRQTLIQLFEAGRPLVCIMALGIVVRILGATAKAKESEPPVVVIDEAGRFAISVLGGHQAGANRLATQAAAALGAQPVITTASEALGLPAIDLIGRCWDWKIEPGSSLTQVSAAVVRGERVGVFLEVNPRFWWSTFADWPSIFHPLQTWPPASRYAGLIVVSDRLLLAHDSCVTFRPPTLVLGVGCRRGVPVEEIEAAFLALCREHGYSPLSLATIATVTLKINEPGLQAFAEKRGVPLVAFKPEQLDEMAPLPTPSEVVRSKIGIAGVAEPAAMLAAGTRELLVPKQRGKAITMALARRADS